MGLRSWCDLNQCWKGKREISADINDEDEAVAGAVGRCGLRFRLRDLRYNPSDRYYRQHICGGTLIAPGWVLCATHCFMESKDPARFRIRTGEWHLKDDDGTETDMEFEKIIVHRAFNYPHPVEHDIALIKLATEVDFSGPYSGPACMPNAADDYHGAEGCWLSGWGLVNPPRGRPNQLQKLQGKIWADADLK